MTTVPDMLRHMGGAPVGMQGFGSFWGNDVYFIDYDSGTAGTGGLEIERPQKDLATALTAGGPWDTYYIRPRAPNVSGGDSNYITPASATNWSVANTAYGTSIIGTGLGMNGHGMAYQTYMRGHASVTTGSVLDIVAPFCSVENLSFHRGGGTTTGIVRLGGTVGTDSAFGSSVVNCLFRFGNGTDWFNGALQITDTWYTMVYDNVFYRCATGIALYANGTSIRSPAIVGNTFEGLAGDITAHIYSNGTMTYVKIVDNHFIDAIPTDGVADYIHVAGGASTGLVANNTFGTTTITASTICTLNGLTFAKNFVSAASAMTS